MSMQRKWTGRSMFGIALVLTGFGLAGSPVLAGSRTEIITIYNKRHNPTHVSVLTRDAARELALAREWSIFKRQPGPFIPRRPGPDPVPVRVR
jgi:hypothetical protein